MIEVVETMEGLEARNEGLPCSFPEEWRARFEALIKSRKAGNDAFDKYQMAWMDLEDKMTEEFEGGAWL